MENKKPEKYKLWSLSFITVLCTMLASIAIITAHFDPSMQFHEQLDGIRYMMSDTMAGYTNPGMIKNYDFDTIILGSSLTHNIRVSWLEEELELNAIRASENGEKAITVNRLLSLAFDQNPNLKNVYCIIDGHLIDPASSDDWSTEYLYKDGLMNKVKYLLNKEIVVYQLMPLFLNILTHRPPNSRDLWYGMENYESTSIPQWVKDFKIYENKDVSPSIEIDKNYLAAIQLNIEQNLIPHIQEHSQTEFHFFIPPYHLLRWYNNYQSGIINKQLEEYYAAVELLLTYDNVKVYSFMNDMDLISDLTNYYDSFHYTPKIAHQIVKGFASSEYLITRENSKEAFNNTAKFFEVYNYEKFYSDFMKTN